MNAVLATVATAGADRPAAPLRRATARAFARQILKLPPLCGAPGLRCRNRQGRGRCLFAGEAGFGQDLAGLCKRLACPGVALGRSHTRLGRDAGDAVGMQNALMHVAL